jgi:hypothetical protein
MKDKLLAPPPPAPITPSDIYYVLFRHKWKILIISAIGVVAALGYWRLKPCEIRIRGQDSDSIHSRQQKSQPCWRERKSAKG